MKEHLRMEDMKGFEKSRDAWSQRFCRKDRLHRLICVGERRTTDTKIRASYPMRDKGWKRTSR